MKIIGRIEKIEILNFNILVQSKIDTGAWRNTLHVDDIKEVNGILNVIIGKSSFDFKKFKSVKVRNSFGDEQLRYAIKLEFKIGENNYKSSFSLTDRSQMKYQCLLGRNFLSENKFIVDVNKKNINYGIKKS